MAYFTDDEFKKLKGSSNSSAKSSKQYFSDDEFKQAKAWKPNTKVVNNSPEPQFKVSGLEHTPVNIKTTPTKEQEAWASGYTHLNSDLAKIAETDTGLGRLIKQRMEDDKKRYEEGRESNAFDADLGDYLDYFGENLVEGATTGFENAYMQANLSGAEGMRDFRNEYAESWQNDLDYNALGEEGDKLKGAIQSFAQEQQRKGQEGIDKAIQENTAAQDAQAARAQDIESRYRGIDDNFLKTATRQIGQGIGQIGTQQAVNLIAPGAGYGLMYAGVAGSETTNALRNGATYEQAKQNGMLKGLTEVGTELVSGGIGGLSKDSGLMRYLGDAIDGIGSPFVKKGLSLIGAGVGEGLEEVASDLISPVIDRATYDPDAQGQSFEEYIESFMGGFLPSVVLGFGVNVANRGNTKRAKLLGDTLNSDQNLFVVNDNYNTDKSNTIFKREDGKLTVYTDKDGKIPLDTERMSKRLAEQKSTKNNIYVVKDIANDAEAQMAIRDFIADKGVESFGLDLNSPFARMLGLGNIQTEQAAQPTEQNIEETAPNDVPYYEELDNADVPPDDYVPEYFNDEELASMVEPQEAPTEPTMEAPIAESAQEIQNAGNEIPSNVKTINTKDGQTQIRLVQEDEMDTIDGLDKRYIKKVNKVAKKLGLNVNWAWQIEGQDASGSFQSNGAADSEGNIYLSLDNDSKTFNPYMAILGHEITHQLEGTAEYQNLVKYAIDRAKQNGTYNEQIQQLSENYQSGEINHELTANLMQEMFKDERFVRRFVNDNRGIAGKILNILDTIVAKLQGDESLAEFVNIRKMFSSAMGVANSNQMEYNNNRGGMNDKTRTLGIGQMDEAGANTSGSGSNREVQQSPGGEMAQGSVQPIENGLYEAGSDQGNVNPGGRTTSLVNNRAVMDELTSKGITPIDLQGGADATAFSNALQSAKADNPYGAFVTGYDAEHYSEASVFMNADGSVGVSVMPDGDIVSVFKNPKASSTKGAMSSILLTALENGGVKLDCYDSNRLPGMYMSHGFIPVARTAFNREYAPSDWNFERDDDPDVVFFIHNGDSVDTVAKNIGEYDQYDISNVKEFDDYDSAMEYRDSLLNKKETSGVDTIASVETQADTQELKDRFSTAVQEAESNATVQQSKKYNDGDRVRGQSLDTVLENPNIADDQREAIADKYDEIGWHNVVTDKAAVERARDKIATMTPGEAAVLTSNMKRSGQRFTKDDGVFMQAAMTKAAEQKNTKAILELARNYNDVMANAGQLLQSAHIMSDLPIEANVAQIARVEKLINEKLVETNKTRHKKTAPIEVNEEYMDRLLNSETSKERDAIVKLIMDDMYSKVPATLADKVNAFRYTMMLLKPATHVGNVASNSFMYLVAGNKNLYAKVLEARMARKDPTFERSQSFYNPMSKRAQDARKFAKADSFDVRPYLQEDRKETGGYEVKKGQKVWTSWWTQPLEKLRSGNNNFLEGEDWIFLKANYTRTMTNYMMANHLTPQDMTGEVLDKARKIAFNEAKRNTFRDANRLADLLNKAENLNSFSKLVFGGLFAFKRTPFNVAVRGVEYSPVGLLEALTRTRWKYKHDTLDGEKYGRTAGQKYIDRLSSGATGTQIAIIGFWLASMGILRTNGDDEDKQYYEESLGMQPYSLRLGNHTFTLDRLNPINMPLFLGVEAYSVMGNNEDPWGSAIRFADAMSTVSDPLVNLSCMQSVNDAFKAIGSSDKNFISALLESTLMSYASSFVSPVLGGVAQIIDPTRRSTYAPLDSPITQQGEQYLRKLANKIPRLRNELEPYIDYWGDASVDERNLFLRIAENLVFPTYIKEVKEPTKVEKESVRLFEKTGNKYMLPHNPSAKVNINGKDYYVPGDKIDEQREAARKPLAPILLHGFNTSVYKNLPYKRQEYFVSNVYAYCDSLGNAKVFSNFEHEDVQKKINYLQKQYSISPADYILVRAQLDENPKVAEITDAIDNLKLTNRQKAALWAAQNKSWKSYNNPFIKGFSIDFDVMLK